MGAGLIWPASMARNLPAGDHEEHGSIIPEGMPWPDGALGQGEPGSRY
jgi:hypothetical protein